VPRAVPPAFLTANRAGTCCSPSVWGRHPVPACPGARGQNRASGTAGFARVFAASSQLVPGQRRGWMTQGAPKAAPGPRRASGRNRGAATHRHGHPRAGQVIPGASTPCVPSPHRSQRGAGKQRGKGAWRATSPGCKIQTEKEKHLITAHGGASAGGCRLRASRREVPAALPQLSRFAPCFFLSFSHFFSNASSQPSFSSAGGAAGRGEAAGLSPHHPPCTPRFCSPLA